MRRRRGREPSILTSPVLIGTLTVLVVIVAVFLAYNANTGLPFVPSYYLHLQMKDASELQKGDDVNMGGDLIGLVKSITATRTRAGTPVAEVNLKLYKNVEPLPVDTRFTVRLKGSIGLKYLNVTLGRSNHGFKNGAIVPVSQTGTTVDFDQVLSMFNPPTAKGIQESTIGLGGAVAGRGYDLNQAIGKFVPLIDSLGPVTGNLASPSTDLAGFFRGLESFSGALAPVAQTQATLFSNLDTTFKALAGVAPSLQNTISQTPPAFQTVIGQSPVIRPFLLDTASLLQELQPGIATIPKSAPVLTAAFEAGIRNLPGTAIADRGLVSSSRTLGSFGEKPAVQLGLDRLSLFAKDLREPLAFLAPVQSSCNYVTLFLRNNVSATSEHVADGDFLDFLPISVRDTPGAESEPSSKPYTGPAKSSSSVGDVGPLHSNPYPNTDSPGEPAECAAGNEPYDASKAVIGNPPGNLGLSTEKTTRSLK